MFSDSIPKTSKFSTLLGFHSQNFCTEIDVGYEKLGEIGFKWILIGVPVRALAPSGFTKAETIVLTSLTS